MAKSIKELIFEVIEAKAKNGESFTAWDVTKAVRKLTHEMVFHNTWKQEIHDGMNILVGNGEYTVRQHDYLPALFYEPVYRSLHQPRNLPIATPANMGLQKAVLNRDKRDRVCILKDDLEAINIGHKPGMYDFAILSVSPSGRAAIFPDRAGFAQKRIAVYHLDKDGNIRIGAHKLAKAGVDIMQTQVHTTRYQDRIELE